MMNSERIDGNQTTIRGEKLSGIADRVAFGRWITHIVDYAKIDASTFEEFDHARPLGLAPGFTDKGKLVSLAIADDKICKVIKFPISPFSTRRGNNRDDAGPEVANLANANATSILEQKVLCRRAGEIFAFDAGSLVAGLFSDHNARVINVVDLQTAFEQVDHERRPISAVKAVIGPDNIIEKTLKQTFHENIHDPYDRNCYLDLIERAWLSQFLPNFGNGASALGDVPRINTKDMAKPDLDFIMKLGNDSYRQDNLGFSQTRQQQIVARNDINTGRIDAQAQAFKHRFMLGQSVEVMVQNSRGNLTFRGEVEDTSGRRGAIRVDHQMSTEQVLAIKSIGPNQKTRSEREKKKLILQALQKRTAISEKNPWIKAIWPLQNGEPAVPAWPDEWQLEDKTSGKMVTNFSNPDNTPKEKPLNDSQQIAIDAMLSDLNDHRIVLVQGPPGTGKTSVIANYVLKVLERNKGIWLIAQSNVAVKNIAEKLMSVGFTDWKLLVSKDFHHEWHEHIYKKVEFNMILSQQFKNLDMMRLKGTRAILCTLSMLSSIYISKFINLIPFRTLIVDEASQIEITNYMPIFYHHGKYLRKVCFIGDDKQLPPHGQEDIEDLQSIFEVSHLRPQAFLLDTQYRMPPQIGDFVSDKVYEGLLKSNPSHPVKNDVIACYFVDVMGAKEQNDGDSFKSLLECTVVLKLGQKLQDSGAEYKIITPYDGQRNYIENQMKLIEGLDWQNKCFNVDSFQGNEEDYIIISLVRSRDVGFLRNIRRTNVMLTRCKRGMFIVTSRSFLTKQGKSTLTGELAAHVDQKRGWLTMDDIEAGRFEVKASEKDPSGAHGGFMKPSTINKGGPSSSGRHTRTESNSYTRNALDNEVDGEFEYVSGRSMRGKKYRGGSGKKSKRDRIS